jgi:hypothetical protein
MRWGGSSGASLAGDDARLERAGRAEDAFAELQLKGCGLSGKGADGRTNILPKR